MLHWHHTIVLSMLLPFVLTSRPAHTSTVKPRIRVLNAELRAALDEGYIRSRTLRRLVDQIERSDLIIHIVGVRAEADGVAASLRWVTAAGGSRFLRISIRIDLPLRARTAILAHELQHALEVKHAGSVRDLESFEALYRRIGLQSQGNSNFRFETQSAKNVEMRVWWELESPSRGIRAGH